MNYRHSFHAGNFADLLKHAALLRCLARLGREPGPLLVIDTHGGAGRYRLSPADLLEGEASALARLMAAGAVPPGPSELRDAVRAEAVPDGVVYPGSPLLAARRLRPEDRLLAAELRPEEQALLSATLRPFAPGAEARLADGYPMLGPALRGWRGRALVLIDPPYERGDDYDRVVEAAEAALAADPRAVVLIWAPLKDLETFDRLLRALELTAAGLALELRLRPPVDPMRMNGCAMIALNPPDGLAAELEAAGDWIAAELGEPGGRAILRAFGPPAPQAKEGAQIRRKRL